MPGEKQVCVRSSPETQQLVKEMCPLDSCRLLFKLAVKLDMVMNVLAAGMEIPEEDLERLRGRCVREVKSTNGSVTLKDAVDYQKGDR